MSSLVIMIGLKIPSLMGLLKGFIVPGTMLLYINEVIFQKEKEKIALHLSSMSIEQTTSIVEFCPLYRN